MRLSCSLPVISCCLFSPLARPRRQAGESCHEVTERGHSASVTRPSQSAALTALPTLPQCHSRACFTTACQWRGCGECALASSATGSASPLSPFAGEPSMARLNRQIMYVSHLGSHAALQHGGTAQVRDPYSRSLFLAPVPPCFLFFPYHSPRRRFACGCSDPLHRPRSSRSPPAMG